MGGGKPQKIEEWITSEAAQITCILYFLHRLAPERKEKTTAGGEKWLGTEQAVLILFQGWNVNMIVVLRKNPDEKVRDVLVGLGYYSTILQAGWFLNNPFYFSQFLRLEDLDASMVRFWWRLSCKFHTADLSLFPIWWKAWGTSLGSLIRALIPFMGAPLSWP